MGRKPGRGTGAEVTSYGASCPPQASARLRGTAARRVQPCPAPGRGIPRFPPVPGLPCLPRPRCQHRQRTKDVAPAQPMGNAPAGGGSLPGMDRLRKHPKRPWGYICVPTTSLTFPPRSLVPRHLQQAPATSRPRGGVLCQAVSHPLCWAAVGVSSPLSARRQQCPVPPHRYVDRCHLLHPLSA